MHRLFIFVVAFIAFLSLGMSSCKSSSLGGGGNNKDGAENNQRENAIESANTSSPENDASGLPEDDEDVIPIDGEEGNSSSIFEDSAGRRREIFKFGGDAMTPLVDYVFVIDNSCSMDQYIEYTRSAFAALAKQSGVFPAKAQVAVMTTMPAEFADFSRVHHSIDKYSNIEKEPGFMSFINQNAIAAFRAVVPGKATRWTQDGCAADWFSPSDKNPGGISCLAAHTQITAHCVGTEAGITSFHQIMQKNKGKALFRKGAVVNVIVVSDAHEPGSAAAEIAANTPTLEKLKTTLEQDNVNAGLKFHAIAPARKCTDEEYSGNNLVYFKLVDEAKGEKLDICNKSTDYQDFMSRMVTSSQKAITPVFVLSNKATKIIRVTVNGNPITAYTLAADQQTLTISNLEASSGSTASIAVLYQ